MPLVVSLAAECGVHLPALHLTLPHAALQAAVAAAVLLVWYRWDQRMRARWLHERRVCAAATKTA